jgi:glycosyltransferase involved in cell wall biosynthesis
MPSLVSVIIPCYNAQKWLEEAIDCCLQQTYPNIEIIVIDDGSTDNSSEIIKSYADKIVTYKMPHRSGNVARNKGIDLSSGKYIQFLDADDYIYPQKIARQVSFLEANEADIVYGDWRHKYHLPNGESFLGKVEIPGEQVDILESLISNWWVALASLMYSRKIVLKVGGWDENLPIVQDRAFFLSTVMAGAKVFYQPGCYSLYRRHGSSTVSTSSHNLWIETHYKINTELQEKIFQMGKLSPSYRQAFAKAYFELARKSLPFDYSQYKIFLNKALTTYPEFDGDSKIFIYNLMKRFIGFNLTEKLVSNILRLKNQVKPFIKPLVMQTFFSRYYARFNYWASVDVK